MEKPRPDDKLKKWFEIQLKAAKNYRGKRRPHRRGGRKRS